MTADPDKFLLRNINFMLANSERFEGDFGKTRIQRHCKIGYNQACYTVEFGLKAGALIEGDKPWLVRLNKR